MGIALDGVGQGLGGSSSIFGFTFTSRLKQLVGGIADFTGQTKPKKSVRVTLARLEADVILEELAYGNECVYGDWIIEGVSRAQTPSGMPLAPTLPDAIRAFSSRSQCAAMPLSLKSVSDVCEFIWENDLIDEIVDSAGAQTSAFFPEEVDALSATALH